MKLIEKTVAQLLEAFRSSEPTPGGGSASALAGSVGAALLAMVSGLPKPRAAAESDLQRLRAAGARSAELSARLATLIDRDSDAYQMVVAAYRLPKGTEAEKAARNARVQDALRAATDAPLEVMQACRDAIEQAALVAAHGNRSASSDVQVALELLGAGLRGAALNVAINLGSVKDEDYAGRLRRAVADLSADADRAAAAARVRLTEDV